VVLLNATPSGAQSSGARSSNAQRSSKVRDKKDFDVMKNPFLFGQGQDPDVARRLRELEVEIVSEPNNFLLRWAKAELLLDQGNIKEATAVLKDAINKQNQAKKRYSEPYLMLASIYHRDKNKALGPLLIEMTKRFPDNYPVLLAVDRVNKILKDPAVSTLNNAALKNLAMNAFPEDKTLQTIKPRTPSTLPPGKCYELVLKTGCFPRFRLYYDSQRCTGDSGVAKYIIQAPDYNKMTFFDPESDKYAIVPIMELMENHCPRTSESKLSYSKVVRTGTQNIVNHKCGVYKCMHRGEDSYDMVYLSDSIAIDPNLIKPVSLICSIPPVACLPLRVTRHFSESYTGVVDVNSMKLRNIPDGIFKVSKSAKQVKTIGDVMFDKEFVDQMF